MTRQFLRDVGHMMAVGQPILEAIARTAWLMSIIFPILNELLKHRHVNRSRYVSQWGIAVGSITLYLVGLQVTVRCRPTKKQHGTILSITVGRWGAAAYATD